MKESILLAAFELAIKYGLARLSRQRVAKAANCATGSVSYHHKSMASLRNEVIKKAITEENVAIVAEALADRHPLAKKAPEALRLRALATFSV